MLTTFNQIRYIFSLNTVPARENMWHFIMFRENIFHITLKRKKYPLNSPYCVSDAVQT
jgi:hypothetical protein